MSYCVIHLFTQAGSTVVGLPVLIWRVYIVVVLLRIRPMWNFKKIRIVTKITISKTKAMTITRSDM